MRLQEIAERISKEIFLGGPTQFFEIAGRLQFAMLIREGLYPSSKVLDMAAVACGAAIGLFIFSIARATSVLNLTGKCCTRESRACWNLVCWKANSRDLT